MLSYAVAAVTLTTLPAATLSELTAALDAVLTWRPEVRSEPALTAIPLVWADATKAAEMLTARLGKAGDITIFADARSNSVFIRANTEKAEQAKVFLGRLDAEARERAGGHFLFRL